MQDSENRFGRLIPASFRYAITSDTDVHTYVLRALDRRNLAHVVKHFHRAAGDTGRDHAPGNLTGSIRFHAAQHDRAAIEARTAELPLYDTQSSASRQHYIDTGRYLRPGEADSA